jgi:hypothetical protein
MQEQKRVVRQVLHGHSDDIASAREPCMGVPDAPFGLEAPRPQPLVREGEALAAVVVLPIVDPDPASFLEDRATRRHAVRYARDELRQVERRIGVMADTEQEHQPVQIVHPPDGAFGDVGRKRKRIGDDPGGLGTGRREGLRVIASQHAGQSPERIRHDTEARRHGSGAWVKRLVVLAGPGRHHQRAVGTESGTKPLDQAQRSSLDRPGGPERRVHQENPGFLDAEHTELTDHLGPARLSHSLIHFPRNSPIGASDSMWSQAIFSVAIIGTARIAPGMPQMYHQKTRPMKSATVLSLIRLP